MKEPPLTGAKKDLDTKFLNQDREGQDETDSSRLVSTGKDETDSVRRGTVAEMDETDSVKVSTGEEKDETDAAQMVPKLEKDDEDSSQVAHVKDATCSAQLVEKTEQMNPSLPATDQEERSETGSPRLSNMKESVEREGGGKRKNNSSSSRSRKAERAGHGTAASEEPDQGRTLNRSVKKIQEKERAKVSGTLVSKHRY